MDMKLNKNTLKQIVREEMKALREQEELRYQPAVVIRMIVRDDFLEQTFTTEEGSVSERIRFVYDEFIRGEAEMERDYEKQMQELKDELKNQENTDE